MDIRKTYRYRLYENSKRNRQLHQMIDIASIIWNHITALQKRFYRLFGKYISMGRMKAHVAKLRMKTKKYAFWQGLNSQTVQDVCERHERAYARFFSKKGGLPRFRKVKKYRSFTLKQVGWAAKADKCEPVRKARGIGVIEINGLALDERVLYCQNPKCGLILPRDHHSAINIRELGHQLILSQSEEDLALWGIRR